MDKQNRADLVLRVAFGFILNIVIIAGLLTVMGAL